MSPNRAPAVAGRFYPARKDECSRMIEAMKRPVEFDGVPVGAIVPHAGWVFSGPTALLSISAVSRARPGTVVFFGAVHTLDTNYASLYGGGSWETPLGSLPVDSELAERLARRQYMANEPRAHRYEHSIEVQLPLIQYFLGSARILPVAVRPSEVSPEVGRTCAHEARELGRSVVFIGSTDLTHYGPAYGFEPEGRGEQGIRWAKDVNDRRFVSVLKAMDAEAAVREAAMNHNACGAGAVAATIAAAKEFGATAYVELEHTTSADRESQQGGLPVNSVGYEAGVFTRPN